MFIKVLRLNSVFCSPFISVHFNIPWVINDPKNIKFLINLVLGLTHKPQKLSVVFCKATTIKVVHRLFCYEYITRNFRYYNLNVSECAYFYRSMLCNFICFPVVKISTLQKLLRLRIVVSSEQILIWSSCKEKLFSSCHCKAKLAKWCYY